MNRVDWEFIFRESAWTVALTVALCEYMTR